jgi:four helix bundle protein
MGVSDVRDLDAFKLAREFKRQVYALVRAHPIAYSDFKYRSQVWDACASGESNIDEGFKRFNPGVFAQFLKYSRASLSEAVCRVEDGVDRGYFTAEAAAPVLTLGDRATRTVAGLQRSQARQAEAQKRAKAAKRRRVRP